MGYRDSLLAASDGTISMRVLKGIRVLECCNFVSGPWTGQMLGEFGAEVIKIENPRGGDPFRSHTPDNYSPVFCAHNRHKKSVTLDVGKPEGAAAFRKLAQSADVVVENFRPGVMDKLGVGWNELSKINPRLIYCAISGFGPTGPYSRRPAYDTVIQAMGGLLDQTLIPENPQITGPNYADSITAMCAVQGILGALFERERSGKGHRVDIPMIDAMTAFLTHPATLYFATGMTPDPFYRPARSQCFVFRCADDRYIAVHMSSPQKFWEAMLTAIGRPELNNDPEFSSIGKRIENFQKLGAAIAPSFLTHDRSTWEQRLQECDVPFAPVNDFEDLASDPQIKHLNSFFDVTHPLKGTAKSTARPVFYDGHREFEAAAAPMLGEHTDEVLQEAGYSTDEIAAWRAAEIV